VCGSQRGATAPLLCVSLSLDLTLSLSLSCISLSFSLDSSLSFSLLNPLSPILSLSLMILSLTCPLSFSLFLSAFLSPCLLRWHDLGPVPSFWIGAEHPFVGHNKGSPFPPLCLFPDADLSPRVQAIRNAVSALMYRRSVGPTPASVSLSCQHDAELKSASVFFLC